LDYLQRPNGAGKAGIRALDERVLEYFSALGDVGWPGVVEVGHVLTLLARNGRNWQTSAPTADHKPPAKDPA
jgi:hypothetical protein